MINSNSFVPGRIYSVVYDSEVELVGKRDGVENPLAAASVTVRRVSSVQAAGAKTWANYLAKRGESPVGGKTWWTQSAGNSCIVVGTSANTLGREYLRGLPRGVTQEHYFVNGAAATPAQVETIRSFKKSNGRDAEFVLLSLSKLANVDKGEGDAE